MGIQMHYPCNYSVQILTSFKTSVLTDFACKHRQNLSRGEPAAYTDHRSLSAYPPSDVEQLSRHKSGSLWLSISINT